MLFFVCPVFNSWYLLMLSISILTIISLFIWTLVVTSFIVSNRHRHHTLTAGSVVLHVIIVIVITVLYVCFPVWYVVWELTSVVGQPPDRLCLIMKAVFLTSPSADQTSRSRAEFALGRAAHKDVDPSVVQDSTTFSLTEPRRRPGTN